MTRTRPTAWFTAVLFGLVALSGCFGTHDTKGTQRPGGTDQTIAPSATFTEDTGAVEGNVLDTEGLPIVGARVGLLTDPPRTSNSDSQGHFTFSEVAPGTWVVQAQALGYKARTVKVDVTAGQITTVPDDALKLDVQELEGVPYPKVIGPLKGRFFCGFYVGNQGDNVLAGPCKPVSFTDPNNPVEQEWASISNHETNIWELAGIVDGNRSSDKDVLQGVVVEIQWTPTQAGATQMQATIESYMEGRDPTDPSLKTYAQANGPSVLKMVAIPGKKITGDSAMGQNDTSFGIGVFPYHQTDPAAAYTDQNFDVWITLWYNAPPPDSYSALAP